MFKFTTMEKKLGYLCGSWSWGGLEMNHLRNALWMKERRHQVFAICFENSPFHQNAVAWGIPTLLIPPHKKYYDFKKGRLLVDLLREHDISHLLIRSTYDMSIAAFAKWKLKNNLHVSYFMEMQFGVSKTNFLHTLRFRFIDLWSCPLPYLKTQVETMTRFDRAKIVEIPSGLDLQAFENLPDRYVIRQSLGLPETPFLFGIIGRFDPGKGQLLLLEAKKRIANPNIHLVFLGEPTKNEGDDYFQAMKKMIAENHWEHEVHLLPFRKEIAPFYKAIDVFVMASKAETFGMVTIESFAAGTPVLGSNAAGTKALLQNSACGMTFEPLNVEDLAAKMLAIQSKTNFNTAEIKREAARFNHHLVCEMVEKHLQLL